MIPFVDCEFAVITSVVEVPIDDSKVVPIELVSAKVDNDEVVLSFSTDSSKTSLSHLNEQGQISGRISTVCTSITLMKRF